MTPDEVISKLEKVGPPTPEWAVQAFERELGVELPEDYKSFLLKCNGGWSDSLECTWEVPEYTNYYGVRTNEISVDIYHVFGFREEEWASIEEAKAYIADQIPPSVLWIMDTLMAPGRWCLGIRDQYVGKVYFWDNDGTYPEGKDENIAEFYLVANSFTEFLEKISIRTT